MSTKLYIKIHNKTGLMYFGKTIKNDVHSYSGSGTRWLNHLNKHGFNYTTIVIADLDNNDNFLIDFALGFSAANNIVESDLWANLKVENGSDGGFDHWNSLPEAQEARKLGGQNAAKKNE